MSNQEVRQTIDDRKLMDKVIQREAQGEVLGIIATTYEMQPDFLETDYLPTLLGLGSWDDRNWSSRIQLERKMAYMEQATIIQDARCYRGRPRSLRLEHKPAIGLKGQKLHAKVTLILYENAVRLIVGSSNLTEPGYRKNREVVTTVVTTESEPAQGGLILQAISDMPSFLTGWWTPGAQKIAGSIIDRLHEWKVTRFDGGGEFVWSGRGEPLWQSFLSKWPAEKRIESIKIISPFWSEEGRDGPLAQMLGTLADRKLLANDADLTLLTDAAVSGENSYRPVLPESIAAFDPAQYGVKALAQAVDPRVLPEEMQMRDGFIATRALHAKVVLFEGKNIALAYAGSANFTHHGWGFLPDPRRANIEAGLIFQRTGNAVHVLQSLIPDGAGEVVLLNGHAKRKVTQPEPSTEAGPWPGFLSDVRLTAAKDVSEKLELAIKVIPGFVTGSWSLEIAGDDKEILFTHINGNVVEAEIIIPLPELRLNILLRQQEVWVRWWESEELQPYPVNVDLDARAILPISPDSGLPGENMLIAYYQGRIAWEELFPPPPEEWDGLDPSEDAGLEGGVDTSRIQSYQIREFVEALQGIRDDLRASSSSEPAMRLALSGPVSPVALAKIIVKAVEGKKRTATAGSFQLLELLACLFDARVFEVLEHLRGPWIRQVNKAIVQIETLHERLVKNHPTDLLAGKSLKTFERKLRQFYKKQAALQ